jgi:glycosyltransferase involved in cell wall biosynthesis
MLLKEGRIDFSILCTARRWPQNGEGVSGGDLFLSTPEVRRYYWEDIELFLCKEKYRGQNSSGLALEEVIPQVVRGYSAGILVAGSLALGIGLRNVELPFFAWFATTFESENKVKLPFSVKTFLKEIRYWFQRDRLRAQELQVLDWCKTAFAISSFTRDAINYIAPEYKEKVSVLPIPVARVSAGIEVKTEVGRILFAGRFTDPRKDINTLIMAFCIVIQSYKDARLVLCGEKKTRSLDAFVKKCGIADFVSFPGKIKSLALEYEKADIVVIPSLQEGLCLTALEAMIYAVPVVSTRCGGPENFIVNGETGLLVPVGNETQMAKAMISLIKDRKLRDSIAMAGAEFVSINYSSDIVISRLNEALDRLLSEAKY